jgi:F-type H+-transporting ATPase subunit gamma
LATAREIKRRIRSVDNIGQITRAMEAVAASRMKRAQDQVLGTRAYAQKAWEVLTHLASQQAVDEALHPLFQIRPVNTMGLMLITSDRGLCGAFNHNMIRRALEHIEAAGEATVQLITVGRQGRNLMLRLGQTIVAEFSDLPASDPHSAADHQAAAAPPAHRSGDPGHGRVRRRRQADHGQ